jgi:hypothetical protein
MTRIRTQPLAGAAVLAAAVAIAGCGSAHNAQITPPAKLVHAPGAERTRIVVSAQGAQQIGLRTARARAARPTVAIPSSALIYDSSGRTYAFVAVGRLTYVEEPVSVARIDGETAYLQKGPHAGKDVVSTGAEELYGVQTGVLGQT